MDWVHLGGVQKNYPLVILAILIFVANLRLNIGLILPTSDYLNLLTLVTLLTYSPTANYSLLLNLGTRSIFSTMLGQAQWKNVDQRKWETIKPPLS